MGNAIRGKDRKIFELELDALSLVALNRLAASQKVSIEQAASILIESSAVIQLFSVSEKRERRRRYMQGYYKKHPDKFLKTKKTQAPEKITVRVQDRIDQTFRDEDLRLKNIKYSFCQNAQCLKPNKKYVEGTGVTLDYDGITLYFCNNLCKQEFLQKNEQR